MHIDEVEMKDALKYRNPQIHFPSDSHRHPSHGAPHQPPAAAGGAGNV